MAKSFTVGMKMEKATKNTIKYEEQNGDNPPMIGTLYVQKHAIQEGGVYPETITVTVETK